MQLLRRLSFTMLLMSMMTLVACGGGDISGDDDDDDGSSGVITVQVQKSDGVLSAENSVTVYAIVFDGDTPVADKTVTFSLAIEGSATLDPIAGTATTDASGIASIDVNVTDVEGSVNVIATYSSASDNISFDSLGDGTPTIEDEEEAASIQLYASTEQLASSGADSVLLTAIAKDIDNNLLEGITISFSSDSGSLQSYVDEDGSSSTVTGADGKVAMLLSTEADASNRDINITAASGDISDSLIVSVMGTTITLTGSSSLAIDDETSYVIKLVDSDGVGIANTTIDVSLSNDATTVAAITLPSEAVVTDSEGQATLNVTGTSGGSNDIVVSAINATASQEVSVQADSFLFTEFSNGVDTIDPSVSVTTPDVGLTQAAELTLTWLREETPVAGATVSFTTTRGVLSNDSATTDDNGQVTVTLTASDAGKALVTLVGSDTTEDIELTNQLEFEFYAETAATIISQASPSSIGPDQQTSTITAVVNDENGNLVKNKTVQFILEDISGGSIYPATAVTDSSGSASTVYTSNSTSAKDGVLITASVDDVEPSIVALTVSDRELFISLGTGNEIEELGTTDYIKEYSVFVTDGDSNAVEGVELTISAIPETYYKGFWIKTYDEDDAFTGWATIGYNYGSLKDCPNEDINFNGILDEGEDTNGDNELTPGNIVSISGTFVTDEDGRSVIKVNYPQSYGWWLDVKLVVSGTVTGSESSTQTIFKLPVFASDVDDEDVTPPQQGIELRGPFGVSNECADNISQDPDNNVGVE